MRLYAPGVFVGETCSDHAGDWEMSLMSLPNLCPPPLLIKAHWDWDWGSHAEVLAQFK